MSRRRQSRPKCAEDGCYREGRWAVIPEWPGYCGFQLVCDVHRPAEDNDDNEET